MRVSPEKKEEKERVTLALLRATLRLAAAHGFVSLGLREVSRTADIAPTSFYRHFADMEELGLALINDLADGFVERWIDHGAPPDGARTAVQAIATRALAGAVEDPELMRFILSERFGAIPSFRAALEKKLARVSDAIGRALAEGTRGTRERESVPLLDAAEATTALLLEACGRALDAGSDRVPDLREQLLRRIGIVVSSAMGAGALS